MMNDETHPPPSPAARHAPATLRNREPILAVLRDSFPDASGTILEIAAGSGEHAAYFARRLAPLRWLPTDHDPAAVASIEAWRTQAGDHRPLAPHVLDVTRVDWSPAERDDLIGIFCANMIHITPWEATLGLLAGATRYLPSGGRLVLYGPFTRNGTHTALSNAAFDQSLRRQDPSWGIRDLEEIETLNARNGLRLAKLHHMPANNLTVVFERV